MHDRSIGPWVACVLAVVMVLPGCVRRTIEISSSPEGALVWVNGREVGRTPVTVDFMHYGSYDLMLKKRGWEPIIDARTAPVPVTDLPGLDFLIEILPVDVHHVVKWHIDMQPRDESRDALLQRADGLRRELEGVSPPESGNALDESS